MEQEEVAEAVAGEEALVAAVVAAAALAAGLLVAGRHSLTQVLHFMPFFLIQNLAEVVACANRAMP